MAIHNIQSMWKFCLSPPQFHFHSTQSTRTLGTKEFNGQNFSNKSCIINNNIRHFERTHKRTLAVNSTGVQKSHKQKKKKSKRCWWGRNLFAIFTRALTFDIIFIRFDSFYMILFFIWANCEKKHSIEFRSFCCSLFVVVVVQMEWIAFLSANYKSTTIKILYNNHVLRINLNFFVLIFVVINW